MDAKTCLKKLEYVGVLAFATVDAQGNPQVRNISAVHYEPDALYFFTARGKDFCRELLEDGRVQILGYTRYKEMIRLSAQAKPVSQEEQQKWIDTIFRETYVIGNGREKEKGYRITDSCIGCGACVSVCPQRCVTTGDAGTPYHISPEHCLHCGNCSEHCPVSAIERV